MTPVESSQIARIGYDATTNTLAIEFARGGLYHYDNVTPELYAKMQAAESKGSFFFKEIKPFTKEYPYRRIQATVPAVEAEAESNG